MLAGKKSIENVGPAVGASNTRVERQILDVLLLERKDLIDENFGKQLE